MKKKMIYWIESGKRFVSLTVKQILHDRKIL